MSSKLLYFPERNYIVQTGLVVGRSFSHFTGEVESEHVSWNDEEYHKTMRAARKSADKLARTIKYVRVIVQQRNKKEENK